MIFAVLAAASSPAVAAVCAEKSMDAVLGIEACQSNSRQTGSCPIEQLAVKFCVNVTGA